MTRIIHRVEDVTAFVKAHQPPIPRASVSVNVLPAVGSLNMCGDCYDVAGIPPDRLALAVGDVTGHGLQAAAVMGMLRSALPAALRAVERPAQALEKSSGCAPHSIEGTLGTTAVKAIVDRCSRMIIYSSAGRPPPVLLHADGRTELVDQWNPCGAAPAA